MSLDWHHLKLLLRWLMYHCRDAKTYHSLCLTCRYCGFGPNSVAHEFIAMKKSELCCKINVAGYDCSFLPDGRAHGYFRDDRNNGSFMYFINGYHIFPFNCWNAYKIWKIGNGFCVRENTYAFHIELLKDIFNFDTEKLITIYKCPCKRLHVFRSGKFYYACKCNEVKLQIYDLGSVNVSFLYNYFWSKKTRIRHAVVQLAELIKITDSLTEVE